MGDEVGTVGWECARADRAEAKVAELESLLKEAADEIERLLHEVRYGEVQQAVRDERKRCAKIAEEYTCGRYCGKDIAKAIEENRND